MLRCEMMLRHSASTVRAVSPILKESRNFIPCPSLHTKHDDNDVGRSMSYRRIGHIYGIKVTSSRSKCHLKGYGLEAEP